MTSGKENRKGKTMEKKATAKKTVKASVKKIDAKRTARMSYYDDDILVMNSTVKNGKNTNVPFLNKKQIWLKNRLLANVMEKNYVYTLESLSNDYRKELKANAEKTAKKQNYTFRKNFKTSDIFSPSDLKSVIQSIYIVERRLFEYRRNDKGNYYVIERSYVANLATFKNDLKTSK